MKSLIKTVLFLLVCIAVGVLIGRAILWWRQAPADKRGFDKVENRPFAVTGEGPPPAHRGFAIPASDLPTLETLLQTDLSIHGTTIGIEYDASLTRQALIAAVSAAHRQNVQVVLLPPPVFSEQDPYPHPLADIAADAEAAHVDYLTISWLSTLPEGNYWRVQSAHVRENYGDHGGKIILAATADVLLRIGQWRDADIIGAIGPFPLARRLPGAPSNVTLHDMRVAWACTLRSLESVANANGKKLALLHMDVPAEVSANLPAPGAAEVPTRNPALQAMLYEALLLETKGDSLGTDVMLFDWGHAEDAGTPNNVPGLLSKIADAWDLKKHRPTETSADGAPGSQNASADGN